MKSLIEYINEGKQIDDKLAQEIVNAVLSSAKDIDINDINKELSKFDYDMEIVLHQIDGPSKKTNLDNTSALLDEIWAYVEEKYPNDENAYYSYIAENLYKFIR